MGIPCSRLPDDDDTLGPTVLVVRVLENGDTAQEWLPALLAVEAVLDDILNGGEVVSARIIWDEIDARRWDTGP
jgi:hypothetical protein